MLPNILRWVSTLIRYHWVWIHKPILYLTSNQYDYGSFDFNFTFKKINALIIYILRPPLAEKQQLSV